jgi:hypothetical protein
MRIVSTIALTYAAIVLWLGAIYAAWTAVAMTDIGAAPEQYLALTAMCLFGAVGSTYSLIVRNW